MVQKKFPVLQPHAILRHIFSETGLRIEDSVLRKYWGHLQDVNHPWATRVLNAEPDVMFIPVGLHGDEASYGADLGAQYKLTCIWMDLPLWRPKNARLSRFLLFAAEASQLFGYASLHPVYQEIVRSLNLAYGGVGDDGKPLTEGGLRFVLSEIRGDQAWHHFTWRFHNRWTSNSVCMRCEARRDRAPWYHEVGDGARWRMTEMTTVEFLAKQVPEDLLVPLSLCHHFDVQLLKTCSMHCVNLGLCFTANGGTLLCLMDLGFFGDPALTRDERLNNAYDDFRQYCRSERISCSQRRFRMTFLIKKSHGAYLTLKAYNGRVVTAWLANCALTAWSREYPDHRLFGEWLRGQNLRPNDERLAPQALAMLALARWFSLVERSPRCL